MNKIKESTHTIPAVDKAIEILILIASSENGISRNDLAASLDITQSTCYRILRTLLKHDWITKTCDNTYITANGLIPLASKVKSVSGISFENAQEILEELALTTTLACKLSVRRGNEQYVLARAESPGPFGVSGKTGVSFPIIEGSVGAALLGKLSRAEVSKLISECDCDILEKHDSELVHSAIRDVRKKGYALNIGHNRWGICAMSYPITAQDNSVAGAVTLVGLENDFVNYENIKKYLSALEKAAEQFSKGALK